MNEKRPLKKRLKQFSGITSDRPGLDVWEFAVMDNATANVITAFLFAEYYVASNAVFNITSSLYFDVFFEICSGNTYNLPTLPELCSLDGDPGAPACFSEDHPVRFFHSLRRLKLTQQGNYLVSWSTTSFFYLKLGGS